MIRQIPSHRLNLLIRLAVGAALATPVAAIAAARYAVGQHVQVREGDIWSPAVVLAQEGRRYHIHYDDSDSSTDEWVTTDRIRAMPGTGDAGDAAAPPPAAPTTPTPQPTPQPTSPAAPPAGSDSAAAPPATPTVPAPPPASPAAGNPWTPGESVEVKFGGNWRKATVAKTQGQWTQVFYPPFDQRREWVEPFRIRAEGSTQDFQGFAHWNPSVGPDDPPPHATPATSPDDRSARGNSSPFSIPETGVTGQPLVAPDRSNVRELSLHVPAGAAPAIPAAPPAPPARASVAIPLQVIAEALMVDPAARFAVASTKNQLRGNEPVTIQKLDLLSQSAGPMIDLPPQVKVLAISPDGTRLLTRSDHFFGGTLWRLDLWSVQGDQAMPLLSFRPYEKASSGADAVTWAQFLDNRRFLTCSQTNEVVQWKLAGDSGAVPTAVYLERGGGEVPARYCDGGLLLIGTGERVAIVDAAKGQALAAVPAAPGRSAVALAPAHDRLAVVGQARLQICTLDGKITTDVGLPPGIGAVKNVDWLNPDLLLLNRRYLYDPRHRCVVWDYQGVSGDNADLQAGRLWYLGADLMHQHEKLMSLALPDPDARAADASATDAAVLAQADTKITLALPDGLPGSMRQQIVDHLTQQLNDAGMVVADNQPISLRVRVIEGPPQIITYRFFGRLREEQATVRRKHVELAFCKSDSDTPVWQNDSLSSGAPLLIHLSRGQTAQDAVDQATRPDFSWLLSTTIPKTIVISPDLSSVGSSQLGAFAGPTRRQRPRRNPQPAPLPPDQSVSAATLAAPPPAPITTGLASALTPSPGTPGEGRGEGDFVKQPTWYAKSPSP